MRQTKKRLSRGRKITLGAIAFVLLAIAGYFAFAYTTDYLRYRTIESYDQRLDEMADRLGSEVIRREKYCYDNVIKLSHNLECYNTLIVNKNSARDYYALVDELGAGRKKGVFCNASNPSLEDRWFIYCGVKMLEWMPYYIYEDIHDLYR